MSAIPHSAVFDLGGDLEESHQVVAYPAVQPRTKIYDEKFKKSFLATCGNENNKGLLTTYLFYDLPPIDPHRMFTSIGRDAGIILSGGMAWERRMENVVKESDGNEGYLGKDSSVIKYSLEHGLSEKLPEGALSFTSYGGGDTHAFNGNEMQIIRWVYTERPDDAHEFCAVDILHRFALGCATTVNTLLGFKSEGILGDFIYNGKLAIPVDKEKPPVVMIFGGPFENTPIIEGGLSPVDATALAWAKLNIQHGSGATVIKTFDTDQSPDLVNGPYAPSRHFEAFVLSAFARAVQQGILEDPQYDVFANWKMSSTFNQESKAIELAAECKADHTVHLAGKAMHFKEGDRRVITLSHKWDRTVHEDIARRAGFEFEVFEEPGNKNLLMLARAVRQPDADLLALMPSPIAR